MKKNRNKLCNNKWSFLQHKIIDPFISLKHMSNKNTVRYVKIERKSMKSMMKINRKR